jgi:hypothetical protein
LLILNKRISRGAFTKKGGFGVDFNNSDRQQLGLAWKGKRGLNLETISFGTTAESETYRSLLLEGNTDLYFLSPRAKDLCLRSEVFAVLTWEWNFLRSLYFWEREI